MGAVPTIEEGQQMCVIKADSHLTRKQKEALTSQAVEAVDLNETADKKAKQGACQAAPAEWLINHVNDSERLQMRIVEFMARFRVLTAVLNKAPTARGNSDKQSALPKRARGPQHVMINTPKGTYECMFCARTAFTARSLAKLQKAKCLRSAQARFIALLTANKEKRAVQRGQIARDHGRGLIALETMASTHLVASLAKTFVFGIRCGSYPKKRTRELANACPGVPRQGSSRHSRRDRLLKGLHPINRVRLGTPTASEVVRI